MTVYSNYTDLEKLRSLLQIRNLILNIVSKRCTVKRVNFKCTDEEIVTFSIIDLYTFLTPNIILKITATDVYKKKYKIFFDKAHNITRIIKIKIRPTKMMYVMLLTTKTFVGLKKVSFYESTIIERIEFTYI